MKESVCELVCGLPENEAELRKLLTPEQFEIVAKNGTERPFHNEYWDHHEDGIYVDVVSGEPLFASVHKFDSGTGWPSFTQPLKEDSVRDISDFSHGMIRTEVRSRKSNSHLGHIFDDGPAPTRKRYCINSGSLRFIPVADLESKGYGNFKKLFSK